MLLCEGEWCGGGAGVCSESIWSLLILLLQIFDPTELFLYFSVERFLVEIVQNSELRKTAEISNLGSSFQGENF